MRPLFTILLFVFLVPIFLAPALSYAQSEEGPAQTLEDVRETLQNRIEDLKRQLADLINRLIDARQARFQEEAFPRTLTVGSTGGDVRVLQEFLAEYTQFYPEGFVTGYFGPLTKAAVERFKEEYGIAEVGFGAKTRAALEGLFSTRETFAVSIPARFLPFSDIAGEEDDGFDAESMARTIHEEINEIRRAQGLVELAWDDDLASVALAHSRDQAADNEVLTDEDNVCQYPLIRHEGFETGLTVRDRVEYAHVPYRSVGENIAMVPLIESRTYSYSGEEPECPEKDLIAIERESDEDEYVEGLHELEETVESVGSVTFIKREFYDRGAVIDLAVEGWMDSPGHRENILFPNYTHSGIGIVRVNNYLIITQNFVGRTGR